jgi:uncharacterized protein with HEPN domain
VTRRSSTRDNSALFLYDIVTFTRQAIEIAAPRQRADLDTDRTLQLALVHLIQMIGQAVGKLPDAFKSAHPDIPWRDIISMRNRIVHEYWEIDSEVVWDTVQNDLPEIVSKFAPLLDAATGKL